VLRASSAVLAVLVGGETPLEGPGGCKALTSWVPDEQDLCKTPQFEKSMLELWAGTCLKVLN
jgi:hypothetical protein